MKVQSCCKFFLVVLSVIFFTGCVTIREGEVGVKQTFGKFNEEPLNQGLKIFNPFVTRMIKVSTQTENIEVGLNIPSKEGLTILSEVSILYNIDGTKATQLLREIGPNYERNVILPIFRSAVSDVTARFYAKDMHTGERGTIELAIKDQMNSLMKGKGIELEAVLLKSIQLPKSLSAAIEQKLEAEQDAQRMEFTLQQAKREAEQKRIEAEGIRDAQLIIAEGLDDKILQFKQIEAFRELANSSNAKIIVTNNEMQMMMNVEGQ